MLTHAARQFVLMPALLHNPKRQRGIALLTIRTEGFAFSPMAPNQRRSGFSDEDSAEESLAYASGYEKPRYMPEASARDSSTQLSGGDLCEDAPAVVQNQNA